MPRRDIEVHGLRELRRALREAEGRSPKELQQANKQAAGIVVREAQRRAPRGKHEGGGRVQPAWQSIKAQATTGRGVIAFGGQRAPHEPVVNFGGTIARHASTSRTRVRRREHIYASIERKRGAVLDTYEDALKRITKNL